MEEDTELRDLVVQTLENNGVLAKVRVSFYQLFITKPWRLAGDLRRRNKTLTKITLCLLIIPPGAHFKIKITFVCFVQAELRASVFLALEEQESVVVSLKYFNFLAQPDQYPARAPGQVTEKYLQSMSRFAGVLVGSTCIGDDFL